HELPGALAHPHRLALVSQPDVLMDQELERRRVLAERLQAPPQPGDVADVVDPPDVDEVLEPPGVLVEVVGDVGGEVRRPSVAPDEDAVLVVPEPAGAKPPRAILLVN